MRLEATSVRAYKDTLTAAHLAEAAIAQGIREIAGDVTYAVVAEDESLTFYNRDRLPLKRLARTKVPLGAGQFSYRITDEEARLNLNASPPDRVERLLQAMASTSPSATRSTTASRLARRQRRAPAQWRGERGLLPQAAAPVSRQERQPDSITELLQIKGVTPAIYNGVAGKPGLAAYVTVKSPGQVNLNTASCVVLHSLGGAGDAECSAIEQARREAPTRACQGSSAGGLSLTTRTFRIEATVSSTVRCGTGDGHRPAQRPERQCDSVTVSSGRGSGNPEKFCRSRVCPLG